MQAATECIQNLQGLSKQCWSGWSRASPRDPPHTRGHFLTSSSCFVRCKHFGEKSFEIVVCVDSWDKKQPVQQTVHINKLEKYPTWKLAVSRAERHHDSRLTLRTEVHTGCRSRNHCADALEETMISQVTHGLLPVLIVKDTSVVEQR